MQSTAASGYSANLEDASAEAERCARRWGGTWIVVPHPTIPGQYTRGMRGCVPGEPVATFEDPLRGFFSAEPAEAPRSNSRGIEDTNQGCGYWEWHNSQ